MLRINELKLGLDEPTETLREYSARFLGVKTSQISQVNIVRRSVDSRKRDNVFFVYCVDVEVDADETRLLARDKSGKLSVPDDVVYTLPTVKRTCNLRPVVVGFGPAGIFSALILARCGLRPLILERGRDVDTRKADISSFFASRLLNEESNVQFGEGGAGAFSDGKLTTGIKNPLCRQVFLEFVSHGAPEEILWSSKPHIGTDRLGPVIKSIREEIVSLGGEVIFGAVMSDIITANGRVFGVRYIKDGCEADVETDAIILACGHSARDTVTKLFDRGVKMQQKPFSIGARIEHPREMIDSAQYGAFAGHPMLGAADYKMACHPLHGRGAYTFCMCPGGSVIAAASEKGGIVVNGMSLHARDGDNSNSALLVGIEPEEFPSTHPLSGFDLQRQIEQTAFSLAGGDYTAPFQLVGDFMSGIPSSRTGRVMPSYTLGVKSVELRNVLPTRVTDTMAGAITAMDRKLHGFAMHDAVLTAPETRSSSPVRILRDELMQTNIRGLYPCGEGAGYAGGIVSAAVDGIKCAEAVAEGGIFEL